MALAVAGILPLAAAISGYLWRPLSPAWRLALVVSAALVLLPGAGDAGVTLWHLAGAAIFAAALISAGRSATESG